MKVVVTDYQYENIDAEKRIIADAGFTLCEYQCKAGDRLKEIVSDADAVITQYADINADVIAAMRQCKVIVRYGIGVDNIDADTAAKNGIFVCNVPDYGVEDVSLHVITLMLACVKKLPIITGALKSGDWGYSSIVPVRRLAGATIGLVGFGRIPQLVAKKLSGFGVKIIAYDPYAKPDVFLKAGVVQVTFEDLCKDADYVSIHCPQTVETKHLFRESTFRDMKQTAILINTARGGIVSEKDLTNALRRGEIAGAALDVFETEPLPKDSPLLNMPQVIATPHCAWYSEEAIANLQKNSALEVVNVLQGNKPWNCVNLRNMNS